MNAETLKTVFWIAYGVFVIVVMVAVFVVAAGSGGEDQDV